MAVDAIAPVTPVAPPPVQPAANAAPAATSAQNANAAQGTSANGASNANNSTSAFELITALENQELINAATAASTNATQNTDGLLLDGALLTNLSPQGLSVLSEVNTTGTAPSTGTLTPAQLEEISTLALDAQILNSITATETLANNGSLIEGSSSITLSPEAASIVNASIIANVEAGNSLTTAQLQQVATIIAPFINQPLTSQTLTQIQNALTAAGFNPSQLSLQNLFLSMSYVGELLQLPFTDAEEVAANEMITAELEET
jgi:hypothetical protein